MRTDNGNDAAQIVGARWMDALKYYKPSNGSDGSLLLMLVLNRQIIMFKWFFVVLGRIVAGEIEGAVCRRYIKLNHTDITINGFNSLVEIFFI